jgi:hypothetical protein
LSRPPRCAGLAHGRDRRASAGDQRRPAHPPDHQRPPGSSKSLEVSVAWQGYEWGPRDLQGLKYLSTSYELGNVTRDTRKTRDPCSASGSGALADQLVREGETSFANERTGTREGVPFASLTAKRGDRLIIDDPHSLDGAESEVEREKAVRRFIEGGQNRLNDQVKSAIVIVMQRLHERDLTGELLARDLGYEHLMIPMEFEPERRCVTGIGWQDPRTFDGELMDPVRFPRAAVELLKKDNDYMWAGQYQQRPAPRQGGMFKIPEDWTESRVVECLPAAARRGSGAGTSPARPASARPTRLAGGWRWSMASSISRTCPRSSRDRHRRGIDRRPPRTMAAR